MTGSASPSDANRVANDVKDVAEAADEHEGASALVNQPPVEMFSRSDGSLAVCDIVHVDLSARRAFLIRIRVSGVDAAGVESRHLNETDGQRRPRRQRAVDDETRNRPDDPYPAPTRRSSPSSPASGHRRRCSRDVACPEVA